jgi:hypothetical protein
MQTLMAGVYDFEVPVEGIPASTQEYDDMAKKVGAALETAIDNDLQHIWKGGFRKKFREALKDAGFPPIEEEGKAPEKDKTHYQRAKALIVGGEAPITMEQLVALRNEVATKVNYSTGGGSSSRIGQEWLSRAAKYLENISDPSQWAAFMENIVLNNPGFVFEMSSDGSTPEKESIAMALKTENSRVLQAAETGLFAV